LSRNGRGAVGADDILPKTDFYQSEPTPPPKPIPVGDIGAALSMQEGDTAILIVHKRATGGFIVRSKVIQKIDAITLQEAMNQIKKDFWEAAKNQ